MGPDLNQIFNMKNLSFIIFIFWVISASCQTINKMELDCIKISPIGISDLPRDTVYISLKKIGNVTKSNSVEEDQLTKKVITNIKTLSAMASFIALNNSKNNSVKRDFNEYGCFNISGYHNKSLIISYNLDRLDSKKYLNSLIECWSMVIMTLM
jgi:hypothetical protein